MDKDRKDDSLELAAGRPALPGGNRGTGDPGPNSTFYRTLDHTLHQQGVTPRQVQIVWLSMPVSGMSWGTNLPPEARSFPADAQQSKHAWKEIVHAIHIRYPNVKMIYSSTKGAMYMSALENPEFLGGPIEPYNHDAAWGVKWVIQDQINGAPDLNYDPARGPVNAPWLSWGPYFWSYPDGTPRHDDGFVWTLADVGPDLLHPSLSGLTKYATMLLRQMTTDPTTTPWFLRPGAPTNQSPTIAKAARVAANPVSGATTTLSVLGADDGGESNLTYTWSCSGPAGVTFSENGPNRAKNTTATFLRAGRYMFQVTIGDNGGLTATTSIGVTVSPAAAFDHATVNSIVANHPPTVATAASATPNPTTGMATNLRVLGDDDGGEANLTYTWSWIGPAGVTFSANGMNAAKNTTATFLNPGRYTFHVAIQDAGGGFAASGTTVTVIGR